ncbi:NlpC/P60 family protein [Sphaerisporangium sp. TRM90804]|uniref:NlpC/P60 family protein n=1 Tax=Sphaerisporangium sp. TRM90804 TaxID=3031113 RepID=UPI002448D71A|nr:NlpC/P60 family protein [Sphaerisporangium sp. TRM90804]MDH2424732.1 NlpC/P60 family protein [Sphaerisporangium sp. TRM90804]
MIVPVVPSARGFITDLKKQVLGGAYKLGQDIGRDMQRGIQDSLKGVYEPLREETRKQQQRAPRDGEEVAGAFARGFQARLRSAFQSLPKAEVDADTTAADAALAGLRTRMQELSSKTVGVDLDAGAALAEVAAIQRELEALDGKNVSADVRVDIASALAELRALQAAVSDLDAKTARPRIDVDVSGALASIGLVAAAIASLAAIPVGASLGAGLLALSGPLAAAGAGFGAFGAVATSTVGRINEALQQQEQATESAAKATKSAAGVAAEAASNSLQLVLAEQRITDAKKTARQAEADLTQARIDAKRAIEDLARSVKDAALAEEDAALSVEEARKRLAEVRADPKADELERKRAELNYRQSVQRLEDQRTRTKRLKEDQAAADKAGIEGSKQVTAAKDRLAAANRQVSQAEAQLRVLRLQQAAAAAKEAQATSGLVTKMAALSPAAKAAAKQIKAFKDAYLAWQEKLEPAVLPVITGGLKFMRAMFKPLTPLIQGTAGALVSLEKTATKALGGKFWTDFFDQLSKEAPGAITGLGKSMMNVGTGIAGIIKAFLPFSKDVVGGIEKGTAAFAKWGKGLGASEEFKAFIAYARENLPKVGTVIQNVATIFGKLFSGFSGDGANVLDVLVDITTYIAGLDPETLRAFALAALGVATAFAAWRGITTVVDGVKKSIETTKSIINGAKTVWGGLGDAASKAKDVVKRAAGGIASAAKTAGTGASKAGSAVWTGIQTAASKAASVARTSATTIANAARTAGAATAKGASAAWSGIQVAASRAGAAAKTAGTAIVTAGRAAATAAVGLGRVAFQYAAIAVQAGVAAARQIAAAAASAIVRAATVAWTAVQWLLNAALNANPIGLIVIAITALVAALIYAWNNSETFRTVVTSVWEAIKTAISAAWTNVIQPALQAIWTFITTVLMPVFTALWNNVIKPAWDGISAAIRSAWTGVIQPALQALWNFITVTLAPKILWLWNTIIKPTWDFISSAIKAAWTNVIQPALQALWNFLTNTLGPKILWFHTNVVQPVFNKVGEIIKGAWDKVIKPVFDTLVKVVTEDIPKGFQTGVEAISKAWQGIQDAAKKPVEFIINTVYNKGIVTVWNAVADILGLKDKRLQPISAFAKGGIYPGYTPGKDVGFAAVSGGEAIMRPEWTRAVGEKYVHGANAAARSGGVGGVARFLGVAGDPGFAGAFAGGGIIGDIRDMLAGGLKAGAEAFLNPLLDQAGKAMGGSRWGEMLVEAPKQMIGNVIKWIGDNDTGSGDGGKAVAFARAQLGKPYQWGATGPNTFDCSGLVMRAWQSAGVGDIPRTTYGQIPWVKPVKKPQPGDLGFPHDGHVWMYSGNNKIIEAPYTGAHVREVAARSAMLIGRPPSLFDSGGFLPMGTSVVHNGTGRPEPVLTDRQWQAIAEAPTRGGDGGPLVNIEHMPVTPEQSPYAIADDLSYILGSRARLRR